MSITQTIYVSRSTVHVDQAELYSISEVAARNNQGLNVTGALIFCNGYFLQILEGAQETVDALLEKISRDARHVEIHVVSIQNRPQRLFEDWTMACLHEASMSCEQLAWARSWTQLLDMNDGSDVGEGAHELLLNLRTSINDEMRIRSCRMKVA